MSSLVSSHGYYSLQVYYLVLLIKAVSLLERNFLTTYSKKEKKNTVKSCPRNGLGLFMGIFSFSCLHGIQISKLQEDYDLHMHSALVKEFPSYLINRFFLFHH